MVLKLHSDCIQRLRDICNARLPELRVQSGMFVRRSSLPCLEEADAALPKNGATHDAIVRYIDDQPFSEFVFGRLSTDLYILDEYQADCEMSLSEIEGYSDVAAVANKLVDEFVSLPWTYTFTFELPPAFNEIMTDIKEPLVLSRNARLIHASTGEMKKYPVSSGDPRRDRYAHSMSLLQSDPEEWDGTYFQMQIEGFAASYVRTAPMQIAVDLYLSFLGIAIAFRFAKVNYSYSAVPPRCSVLIHKWHGKNDWRLEDGFDLDRAAAKLRADLSLEDLGGNLVKEQQIAWARHQILECRYAFSAGKKGERILQAALWLFNSYSSDNELLAFVEAMVALEILLGDKADSEKIGVGELLKNRCAYLVGQSQKEREEILADFSRIYSVRSQIVHRGKSRLRRDERVLFYKLRWLCARTIQEEIKLLKAEEPSTPAADGQ